jgi:ubiquinone/menaquinone biosynthesis C-methylase UbiE
MAENYVPALRFRALTAVYDPLIRLTTRERRFKGRLLERAALQPGERVLDLACGTGTLALEAKRRQPGAPVTGIDGDPEILDRARRKAAAAGLDVEFNHGLSTELPYPDDSFDVVLSTLFFHHLTLAAKEKTAREVNRVLAPGGRFCVADWGPPQDPLMALLFLGVRLLDGFEQTRENATGALPSIFAAGGLEQVAEIERLRTAFGSLALYEASAGPSRT